MRLKCRKAPIKEIGSKLLPGRPSRHLLRNWSYYFNLAHEKKCSILLYYTVSVHIYIIPLRTQFANWVKLLFSNRQNWTPAYCMSLAHFSTMHLMPTLSYRNHVILTPSPNDTAPERPWFHRKRLKKRRMSRFNQYFKDVSLLANDQNRANLVQLYSPTRWYNWHVHHVESIQLSRNQ